MKKPILILIALTWILTNCVTQRRCYTKYPPVTSKDSVYIETIKEIPIVIKGDTIIIDVPVDCPDQDVATIENGKLKQRISILNGKLISRINIKPDTVIVTVTETMIDVREVKVPQPVRYVPKIYKIALWICIFMFAGIFIFIGYKVFK